MFKTGMRVEQLTKRVGQVPRQGRVTALHEESAEVAWEDGHTSIVSRRSLHPVKTKTKA